MNENKQSNCSSHSNEWKATKRWNPFNSYKLLAHVSRWHNIKRNKPIPPPVLITVDPTNTCNFNCVWCNAAYVRTHCRGALSEKVLSEIADFLPRWGDGIGVWKPGVEAICVAGGGEPLLNPATPLFIERTIANGVEVGLVTNGSLISTAIDTISQCTWVGVSIDAGTAATFDRFKMVDPEKRQFQCILDNIAKLVEYSRRHNNRLGSRHPAYGVSYKYLLYRENIGEIYEAARIAKEIGCKNIHFRPAGSTWNDLGGDGISFSKDEIGLFNEQIALALELDDATFNVYGITHKFNSQFEIANHFSKCYAIFMTAVIMPSWGEESGKDSFTLALCCDRRGDSSLELARNLTDVQEINKLWGREEHWRIHDSIKIRDECPRCTYQPHNEIYEQVILNDSMTYKFI
jgi:MoaA/NifB/PqqE/SkfB family radical SAM enzyme